MPVTLGVWVANMGERALKAGHAVASRLIAGVRDVACTRFVAPFTNVPSGQGGSKICEYVIVYFNIVINQIHSFDRVDLLFKYDVFTSQTVIGNYLLQTKIFLESDNFGNLRTVRQIDPDCLE